MGMSYVTSLRTAQAQAIITALGANAVLQIRSGTRPVPTANAAALPAATGTLLATITFGATFGTAANGAVDVDEAGATQNNANHVSGTPGYARLTTSGGTAIVDIDIGGTAPNWSFSGTIAPNQNVSLNNLGLAVANIGT